LDIAFNQYHDNQRMWDKQHTVTEFGIDGTFFIFGSSPTLGFIFMWHHLTISGTIISKTK